MPKFDPYPGESDQQFAMRMFEEMKSRGARDSEPFENRWPTDMGGGPPPMVDPRVRAIQDMMDAGGGVPKLPPMGPGPDDETLDDFEQPRRQY